MREVRSGGLVALNHAHRDQIELALHDARMAAYDPGEFVGQESFMRASEVLRLAAHVGVRPECSLLDLCCGVGGPGLLIARTFGCDYHGVDASETAVAIARRRARDLPCRFDVMPVPPLPSHRYDVVLLLETFLAFPDKSLVLRNVYDALTAGGRFAFTLEEGEPLTDAEQAQIPNADTVWLVPLSTMLAELEAAGFRVRWQAECTGSHLDVAQRLHAAFAADAARISARIGADALSSLLDSHRAWSDWLRQRRVRKFAFVADRPAPDAA